MGGRGEEIKPVNSAQFQNARCVVLIRQQSLSKSVSVHPPFISPISPISPISNLQSPISNLQSPISYPFPPLPQIARALVLTRFGGLVASNSKTTNSFSSPAFIQQPGRKTPSAGPMFQ